MKIRKGLYSLIAALMLGGLMFAPASAVDVGTVPVSVNVVNGGGTLSVGIGSSSGFNFGSVTVDAVGTPGGGGVVNAGNATLVLAIEGDTSLFNANAFDITIKLQNGYLGLSPIPVYLNSTSVSHQIPGRYLSITAVGNPQQAKYTGGSGCPDDKVYDGNATTASSQCAPRDAAGAKPIYRVSDPVGLYGAPDYNGGPCRIAGGATPVAWPTSCPDSSFSDPNGSKLIMHFRPGSGTIRTEQTIEMTLDVPAGVYPGQYSGTLVVEQVPLI